MLIQLVFGWPLIVTFLVLALVAIYRRSHRLMIAAFVLSLPNAFYWFGGNGLALLVGAYVPLSLLLSAWLLKERNITWALRVLAPTYAVYGSLGFLILTQ